jgi:hypothetical protein
MPPFYQQEYRILEQMLDAAKQSFAEVQRQFKEVHFSRERDSIFISYFKDEIEYKLGSPFSLLRIGDRVVDPFLRDQNLPSLVESNSERLHIKGFHVFGTAEDTLVNPNNDSVFKSQRAYFPDKGLFSYTQEEEQVTIGRTSYTEQRTFLNLDMLCRRVRVYKPCSYVEELWVDPKTHDVILLSTETKNLPAKIPRTVDWSIRKIPKESVGTAGLEDDGQGISLLHVCSMTPIVAYINGKQIPIAFYDPRAKLCNAIMRAESEIGSSKVGGARLNELVLNLQ